MEMHRLIKLLRICTVQSAHALLIYININILLPNPHSSTSSKTTKHVRVGMSSWSLPPFHALRGISLPRASKAVHSPGAGELLFDALHRTHTTTPTAIYAGQRPVPQLFPARPSAISGLSLKLDGKSHADTENGKPTLGEFMHRSIPITRESLAT